MIIRFSFLVPINRCLIQSQYPKAFSHTEYHLSPSKLLVPGLLRTSTTAACPRRRRVLVQQTRTGGEEQD